MQFVDFLRSPTKIVHQLFSGLIINPIDFMSLSIKTYKVQFWTWMGLHPKFLFLKQICKEK